jgi:hypothetical protein
MLSPELPLCFLLGWRMFPSSWRSGFGQALPDERRAPEGLGAWGNPWSQVDCPHASKGKTVSVKRFREDMQQPHITSYADIGEVRTVTGAAACNQLLAEGWVLLGTYPLTTVADMEQQPANGGRKQDIQRYVRRLVAYVVGKKREP